MVMSREVNKQSKVVARDASARRPPIRPPSPQRRESPWDRIYDGCGQKYKRLRTYLEPRNLASSLRFSLCIPWVSAFSLCPSFALLPITPAPVRWPRRPRKCSCGAASVPSVTRICFCRPRGLALSQMRSYSENSFKMQNVNILLPYQVTKKS